MDASQRQDPLLSRFIVAAPENILLRIVVHFDGKLGFGRVRMVLDLFDEFEGNLVECLQFGFGFGGSSHRNWIGMYHLSLDPQCGFFPASSSFD